MGATDTLASVEQLDIVGCEFGRLLVLDTITSESPRRRRDGYRFKVQCSCGTTFVMFGRRLLRGDHMCKYCESRFRLRYGIEPEREAVTLDSIREAIAERDSQE